MRNWLINALGGVRRDFHLSVVKVGEDEKVELNKTIRCLQSDIRCLKREIQGFSPQAVPTLEAVVKQGGRGNYHYMIRGENGRWIACSQARGAPSIEDLRLRLLELQGHNFVMVDEDGNYIGNVNNESTTEDAEGDPA